MQSRLDPLTYSPTDKIKETKRDWTRDVQRVMVMVMEEKMMLVGKLEQIRSDRALIR